MKIGYLMQLGEEIRKPPFNGPANHVRQVMLELARLGHSVSIVFRLDGCLWKSDDLHNFEPITVKRIDRGLPHLFERSIRRLQFELKLPYFAFFESLRFALACRQELKGCDLLYERMSWMAYGGSLAAGWQKIPLVLEYNGDPLADLEAKGEAPHGLQLRLSRAMMKINLESPAHLVATGEGWRKNCIERWGVAPDKVTTVENGSELVSLLNREQLRSFQPCDQPGSLVTLAYLGGFYPWHGVNILLAALSDVARRGHNVRLVLIGTGVGENEAVRLTEELGISNIVNFMGHLAPQAFAPLLADADIGLSPYCGWAEYSGLKIFDYKAAGLPTIASGKDGQPHTLRHGETGWIVPPCDTEALEQAIIDLATHPELRQRMGRQARIEAEQIHGWDHTTRQLEGIFIKTLESHSSWNPTNG